MANDIPEMPAEEDHPVAAGERALKVIEPAHRLDHFAGTRPHQRIESRVLGDDAPQFAVVECQDALAFLLTSFGERVGEIIARNAGAQPKAPREISESGSRSE